MPEQNYKNIISHSNYQSNEQKEKPIVPQLIIIGRMGIINCVDLEFSKNYIGRSGSGSNCSILIDSPLVSSVHGYITLFNGGYYYVDCDNKNGTYYNNEFIKKNINNTSNAIRLKDGDILSVGNPQNSDRVAMIFSKTSSKNTVWKKADPSRINLIKIGRDPESDICISNVTVSRNHAVIQSQNTAVYIKDNNSHNGTKVNGAYVREKQLDNMDRITIASTNIFFINNYIYFPQEKAATISPSANLLKSNQPIQSYAPINSTGGFDVEVRDISRMVSCKKGTGINGGSKKYILQNVSLTIGAGEIVAICGGSGAGKTTFMNCINGFEPATSGQVLVNNTDLYKNYSSLKNHIGYVPQQDIVHDNLTLHSMLTYTAKLRLQSDITKNEIEKRVQDVLEMVDLTEQKDTFIKKLSGGQRKRASIAVELVSDPSLFFLDEPTSGLDPEAETHLMHSLKKLSREKGKTVIVITHTLQNIHLFDKIVFLAPGGRLCFYGTPQNAKLFFGVDNLADAYEKISENVDGYVNKFANI
ncbi:MAG: ATP-binding cassette domain-containing protein [Eubacterium sp.]